MKVKTSNHVVRMYRLSDDASLRQVSVEVGHDASANDPEKSFKSTVFIRESADDARVLFSDIEPDDLLAVGKLLERAANVIRSERVEMRSRAREA